FRIRTTTARLWNWVLGTSYSPSACAARGHGLRWAVRPQGGPPRMPPRRAAPAALAAAILLLTTAPALAFITRLVPLKEVVSAEQWIFVATVEKIDPDRPAVVFTVGEVLKGKPAFERLPVNFTGDSEAKKHDHTAQLLKRLKPSLPVLVFASPRGPRVGAVFFTEGTWFQVQGTK